MADNRTVHDVTYELLRELGLTTVFGNPGSTEQTFLRDFPADFTYVLALQEASALAMADGFAQATGKPALVNLHTAAGTGNAMGSLVAAYKSNTPLIVMAGQQTREMVLLEPYLTNRDETLLPMPWVKWAYQPARAEDVPAAFMRAYSIALQPPAGPVFLSIPLDDWDKTALGPAVLRTVSRRTAPDPPRLREFADRINQARSPVLVFGPEVDRAGAWYAGITLAEKLRATVYNGPLPDRISFPEDHPQYAGQLPMTIAEVHEVLTGHDLVLVVGAQVFRYYPYVAGDYLPEGTNLLQVTADPSTAGAAPVGDSLLGDPLLVLDQLLDLVNEATGRDTPAPAQPARVLPKEESSPLTPAEVYSALSTVRPDGSVLVNESTSTMAEQRTWLPTLRPASFYATGSGGIGRPGRGRRRAGRPQTRDQPHGHRDHRGRLVPVLRPVDLDGGPARAADRLRGDAQRGVRHPQVLRPAGEDPGRARTRPARPGHHQHRDRFRLPCRARGHHAGSDRGVHRRADGEGSDRHRGPHQARTAAPRLRPPGRRGPPRCRSRSCDGRSH
ncbi:MAG TPA: benzoylformate decarboxylase [Pseudonocardiaceae bacterium]|nr:benzoylformate decarboxylase [Pseudonocardiaceae bacterium]